MVILWCVGVVACVMTLYIITFDCYFWHCVMFVFVMFSSSLAYLDVPVTPLSGDQRRSSLERSTSLHNSFPNSPQRSSPQMMVQTSMGPVEPSKSSLA